MKALILIGGRGTRLRPLTLATPKPLLPVVNRPFVRYQLDVLARGGVDEAVLCAADPAPFRKSLGARAGRLRLRYVSEDKPLGTAGAVRNAAGLLDGEREFLVLNGDVLNTLDVRAFVNAHRRSKALATLALTRVADPTAYGLVRTSPAGRVTQFVEKPSADEVDDNVVNAGLYVFSRQVLKEIGDSSSLERDVFPRLLAESQLAGFETKGYWIDIGTMDRYLQVHLDILGGRTGLPVPKGARPTLDGGRLIVGPGGKIDATARFSGHVSLGARCRVAAGASLKDCVVLDGARIGESARVERCVIGPRCVVGRRAELLRGPRGACCLAEASHLKDYSLL